CVLGVTVALLTGAAPAVAVDYAKIDRTIAREPAYQKAPKYCLVVFGPQAKTRVWLGLDGEVPYPDRNRDADPTRKDKRFPKKFLRGPAFQVGTIPPPPGGDPFSLTVEVNLAVEGPDSYTIWCRPQEGKGFLQRTFGVLFFADRPQDAPVVHFGGPLTLAI